MNVEDGLVPVRLIGGPLDGHKMLAHPNIPKIEVLVKTDLEIYHIALYKYKEDGVYSFDYIKQS